MTPAAANLPFSQFVEFAVDPHHQAGLVGALNERFERFTRTYPGFVRASVQVSEDRQRVLSHVQWLSKTDCERAFANTEQGEGDFWELMGRHRATSMTFNAYEVAGEIVGPRQS
jgi:heme-degrading monooxygenase HmoA